MGMFTGLVFAKGHYYLLLAWLSSYLSGHKVSALVTLHSECKQHGLCHLEKTRHDDVHSPVAWIL